MKPILFNTDMVRAILDGRKTVTRRVIKPQPSAEMPKDHNLCKMTVYDKSGMRQLWYMDAIEQYPFRQTRYFEKFSPYTSGDILYVRETWAIPYGKGYYYAADYDEHDILEADNGEVSISKNMVRWHPSIHMPREAARIFLRVTDVRVERLWDITENEAKKEGVPCDWPMNAKYCPRCKGTGLIGTYDADTLGYMDADCPDCKSVIARFRNLWNSTIKPKDRDKYGWDANPWVWVVSFERIEKPEEVTP